MQLYFRLHPQGIELCAVRGDDEVVYAGFVAPVVGLGRMLGVEVSRRPFVELWVDGEGTLIHLEVVIAHDDHFVQIPAGWSPFNTVGVRAVADVLPVFTVRLVRDEGTAIRTAEAIVDDCVGALFNDGVAGFVRKRT